MSESVLFVSIARDDTRDVYNDDCLSQTQVILELTRRENATFHIGQDMKLSQKMSLLRTKMHFDRPLMNLNLKYKVY